MRNGELTPVWTLQFPKILLISLSMLLCLKSQAIGQEKHNVKLACGDDLVEIVCGRDKTPENEDARKCNMNKLIFTNNKGKVMVPSTPKGFDITKTPSIISCGRSKNENLRSKLRGQGYTFHKI